MKKVKSEFSSREINPLKIIYVYFGWGYTGYRPGWQRFDIIVKELERSGNLVYIVGLAHSYNSLKDKLLGRVHTKNNIINLVAPILLRGLDLVLNKIGFLGGLAHALMFIVIVKKINPDVIILQDELVGFNFWFLLYNQLFLKKKVIVDYQDLIVRLSTFGEKALLRKKLGIILNEIIIPKMAKKLIVITEYARNFFLNKVGKKEIYIVRELINPKCFEVNVKKQVTFLRRKLAFKKQDKIILWIGYVGGRALPGLIDLIEACGISQSKPKLLIVGSGDGKTILSLKKLAYRKGVSITFHGYVQPLSKMHIAMFKLASVGFFSLPNETFAHFVTGIKLAEYMGAGLPVIAPKLMGPSEVVKGNGLLYSPGNPNELAQVIDTIFNMDLKKLGERSKQIAARALSPESFRVQLPNFLKFLIE